MFEKIDAFLARSTKLQLWIALPLLIALIGGLDLASGYELSFSIFYVLPISIAAWGGSRRQALILSLLSAVTWFAADHVSEHQYSHPAIAYWNASVRLGYFCCIALLLARLRHALDVQRGLAQLDGLTGLLNARMFHQHCDQVIKLAARHDHSLALAYLDLDGFKGINDKFGHSLGDQVLKSVAKTIAARLRDTDCAARMGGDEYAVLLPETDQAGASAFFAEMRENLLTLASEKQWPLGFSIGVAIFNAPTVTTDEAIGFADQLMYQVKKSGKNALRLEVFADPGRTGKI